MMAQKPAHFPTRSLLGIKNAGIEAQESKLLPRAEFGITISPKQQKPFCDLEGLNIPKEECSSRNIMVERQIILPNSREVKFIRQAKTQFGLLVQQKGQDVDKQINFDLPFGSPNSRLRSKEQSTFITTPKSALDSRDGSSPLPNGTIQGIPFKIGTIPVLQMIDQSSLIMRRLRTDSPSNR